MPDLTRGRRRPVRSLVVGAVATTAVMAAALGLLSRSSSSKPTPSAHPDGAARVDAASSDPAGLALNRRVRRAMAAVQRGTISGDDPGGHVTTESWDYAAAYRDVRFTGGWLVASGSSAWTRRDDEACWGPADPAALTVRPLQVAYMLALFGLPPHQRFGRPKQQSDGATVLSWRGSWSRGTAIIDPAGRITELRASTGTGRAGVRGSWHYTLAYPDSIEHLGITPRCSSTPAT